MNPARRPATLVLPPLPYGLGLYAGWWLDHRHPWPMDAGPWNPILGWLLVATGLTIFLWTLATLWRHRTTVNPYMAANSLVTDGPFRFTRNPIYVGDWFIYAGATLLLATAWPLVFVPLIWVIIRFGVIRHEEAHLEARFGPAYQVYRSQVRRWL